MAVSGGNPDVVKLLLDAGANCSVFDFEGIYPIHLAAKEGQAELVPLLVNNSKFLFISIFYPRFYVCLSVCQFARNYVNKL